MACCLAVLSVCLASLPGLQAFFFFARSLLLRCSGFRATLPRCFPCSAFVVVCRVVALFWFMLCFGCCSALVAALLIFFSCCFTALFFYCFYVFLLWCFAGFPLPCFRVGMGVDSMFGQMAGAHQEEIPRPFLRRPVHPGGRGSGGEDGRS